MTYPNQAKAANEISNRFSEGAQTVLLSGECQSGKTGAVYNYLERECKLNKLLRLFMIGPSDTVLRIQTQDRYFESDSLRVNAIQNKVFHAANVYNTESPKFKELVNIIRSIINLGQDILVVWDEAHIGAGTTKRKTLFQRLPAFFDEILGGIPGTEVKGKVKYLIMTATPYSYDYYIKENPAANEYMAEVWLDAGAGYIGIRELLAAGRLLPNIPREKVPRHEKEEDNERFVKDLTDKFLLPNKQIIADQGEKKYIIIRSTVASERPLYKKAVQNAGLPYREFMSSSRNIPEFEKVLSQPPDETMVLFIHGSYKQGKTLPKKYIGVWYEGATKNGRNHADIYQSAGRNLGYLNSDERDYSICVSMPAVKEVCKHIEESERRNFSAKRALPLTCTQKKVKTRTVTERGYEIYDSIAAAQTAVLKREPNFSGRLVNQILSNNKRNALNDAIIGNNRNSEFNRRNILYCDAPGPGTENMESWNSHPELHGKYVYTFPTGNMCEKHVTTSTSMLDIIK